MGLLVIGNHYRNIASDIKINTVSVEESAKQFVDLPELFNEGGFDSAQIDFSYEETNIIAFFVLSSESCDFCFSESKEYAELFVEKQGVRIQPIALLLDPNSYMANRMIRVVDFRFGYISAYDDNAKETVGVYQGVDSRCHITFVDTDRSETFYKIPLGTPTTYEYKKSVMHDVLFRANS